MPYDIPPEPLDIAGRLEWARHRLEEARSNDALLNAVLAIRSLVMSVHHPEKAEASPLAVQGIAVAINAASADIVAAAESISADYVRAGLRRLGRILWLFGRSDDELVPEAVVHSLLDDLDRTALLADELSAAHLRQRIADREASGVRLLKPLEPAAAVSSAIH